MVGQFLRNGFRYAMHVIFARNQPFIIQGLSCKCGGKVLLKNLFTGPWKSPVVVDGPADFAIDLVNSSL